MSTLGLKSVHDRLAREDLNFASMFGWLAAISATLIIVVMEIFS